ncbi:DUF6286 domain-containing Asp23/Gls24 family envelope stress response protein [Streptomyces niveus]|uniref:DUF6286 domain-containing Asp23/Gls24 family envelope stress response protein n=1 Tax=Streptomyces niveus TaxID=193462 RepID=UPI0034247E27
MSPPVSPLVPPPADRGATRIADRVVRRVAGRAAEEVLRPVGGEVVRASADVRGSRVDRIQLDVGLAYPTHLETSGADLQQRVAERTALLTGLTVSRTSVRITRLAQSPPPAVESAVSAETAGPAGGRRPWSERRVPAAVFALIGAVVCGALLADVVAVTLGRAPSDLRVRALDWLTGHGPADTAVAVGAAVATVAGLWLLLTAFTPGLRGRLAMAGPRTSLDRPAAAALVRHRAADVPGVARARVTAGRRRIVIRARITFGDPDEVRDALRDVSRDVVTGLGLAKPPRVRVRVSRDAYWQPPRPMDPDHKEATPDVPAHAPAPTPTPAP